MDMKMKRTTKKWFRRVWVAQAPQTMSLWHRIRYPSDIGNLSCSLDRLAHKNETYIHLDALSPGEAAGAYSTPIGPPVKLSPSTEGVEEVLVLVAVSQQLSDEKLVIEKAELGYRDWISGGNEPCGKDSSSSWR
jgi:hypothetical protein